MTRSSRSRPSASPSTGSGCSGLDTAHSQAQATLQAWATALGDLNTAAANVEAKWLKVCNDINTHLALDTSKTTAKDACGVLNTYIHADLQKNVAISLAVTFDCQADLHAQASCEGSCNASANCDVMANCTGGEVVTECKGTCHGQCDVTQPSFMCSGIA